MSGYKSIKGDKIMGGSMPDEAVDAKLCDLLNGYFQQFLELTSEINYDNEELNRKINNKFYKLWNEIPKPNFFKFEIQNLRKCMHDTIDEYNNFICLDSFARIKNRNFLYCHLNYSESEEKINCVLNIINYLTVLNFYYLSIHIMFKFNPNYEPSNELLDYIFKNFEDINVILKCTNIKKHLENKISFDIKSFYKYEIYSSKSISECK